MQYRRWIRNFNQFIFLKMQVSLIAYSTFQTVSYSIIISTTMVNGPYNKIWWKIDCYLKILIIKLLLELELFSKCVISITYKDCILIKSISLRYISLPNVKILFYNIAKFHIIGVFNIVIWMLCPVVVMK